VTRADRETRLQVAVQRAVREAERRAAAKPMTRAEARYIAKWNGIGWACHDTVRDWNLSVHGMKWEAMKQAAIMNDADRGEGKQ
jgi:hypothetical protein